MKKHIPINRILLVLIILVSVVLVLGTYLYVRHDNPPIEFYNLPFPINKQEYSYGDNIIITVDYCRYTSVHYVSNVDFVDGLRFSLPETHRAGTSEGCGIVDVAITVPDNLPPGTYYLKGKNEYEVNFLATRVVEWTSEVFEVIP